MADRQSDRPYDERPSTRSVERGRAVPRAFDVFVIERGRRWMVGLFGHPLVACWRTCEIAKARACDFARAQGVAAWLVGPDASFEPLVRRR